MTVVLLHLWAYRLPHRPLHPTRHRWSVAVRTVLTDTRHCQLDVHFRRSSPGSCLPCRRPPTKVPAWTSKYRPFYLGSHGLLRMAGMILLALFHMHIPPSSSFKTLVSSPTFSSPARIHQFPSRSFVDVHRRQPMSQQRDCAVAASRGVESRKAWSAQSPMPQLFLRRPRCLPRHRPRRSPRWINRWCTPQRQQRQW